MGEKQKIQIAVPANLRHSSLIRHMADEIFGIAKFSKPWCSRLKLVADELFMNAVRYGSTVNKSLVYVTFFYDDDEIQFTIEDDGTGPQAISVDALKEIIKENENNTDITRISGRGLSMITELWTDSMEVAKSSYGGIAITIRKRLDASPPPHPAPSRLIQQMVTQMTPGATPKQPQPAAGAKTVYEIKLSGEIDQSNVREKIAPIDDRIEVMPEGSVLVLDFSGVTYINSTFIGHLAAWHTSMHHKRGAVHLKNLNNSIKDILGMVGLLKVLEVE